MNPRSTIKCVRERPIFHQRSDSSYKVCVFDLSSSLLALFNTMAVREVLLEEYDELDQKLEKELPLSICVSIFSSKLRKLIY